MSIQEFELLHGAVLTKIMRSGRPVTLRLIETRPSESWATYTINDALVMVKYATVARERRDGSVGWNFTWSPTELARLADAKDAESEMYAALVCGRRKIQRGTMEVCFLELGQLERCIDLSATSAQSVIVVSEARKSLRVIGPRNGKGAEVVVSRNRLDNWEFRD